MNNFLTKLSLIFKDKGIRKRIIFTLSILVVFRFLAAIPIPGIDLAKLSQLLANNQFLGLLNIFSGGGLNQLSIIMLGVGPYITGSIIMQLLTIMSPKLKAMYQEEGEAGRAKFSQFSRLLSVPLAILQSFGFLILLQNQNIIGHLSTLPLITNILVITGGSILLMWLGEIVTEFGIGNGVSLIIFAGIVAYVPTSISQALFTYDPSQIPLY
ncbi:MAG: preprotein translocase subunit SecY, partial [Patescibacteria group bacterium]